MNSTLNRTRSTQRRPGFFRQPLDSCHQPEAIFHHAETNFRNTEAQRHRTRRERRPRWDSADQRFNVNLSILFTELPLLERPERPPRRASPRSSCGGPGRRAPAPERSGARRPARRHHDARGRPAPTGLELLRGAAAGAPTGAALSVPGEESEKFRANRTSRRTSAASRLQGAANALYGNRVGGRRGSSRTNSPWRTCVLAAPRGRPRRRRAAHRGAQQAGVAEVPDRERPRRSRSWTRVNAATGLGNAQVPDGPVPPVHERRGTCRP